MTGYEQSIVGLADQINDPVPGDPLESDAFEALRLRINRNITDLNAALKVAYRRDDANVMIRLMDAPDASEQAPARQIECVVTYNDGAKLT